MTRAIQTLSEVAQSYDVIVLDQWGVLHDGTSPYPGALSALDGLRSAGTRLAVLSNSGKRAAPNAARIADMGLPEHLFEQVMTSGEALWRDIDAGRITETRFLPIERNPGDALGWSEGLDITLVTEITDADAVLLMGLPDTGHPGDWHDILASAAARGLTVYCSNPDLASPRAGGKTVISPGALAQTYEAMGGRAVYYGKPHKPIFAALQHALTAHRLLMVGDSLVHDIAGAASASWDSVLVQGGLYAADFAAGNADAVLARLCAAKSITPPTYRIEMLS